jgi:hypothetical protein
LKNIPWNVWAEGLVEATSALTLGANFVVKSQRKSKFLFRSTPIEAADPVDDLVLRFFRQQLFEDWS